MNPLFTIGHSNHDASRFLAFLRQHSVQAVADVRSKPFSGRFPQFNRPILESNLKEAGIRYVFLGKELGARRDEQCCYVEGQARYDRVAEAAAFASGLERVLTGLETYRVALLCAERDPITCHRTILVSRHLRGKGFPIQHILADGTVESQAAAETRLLQLLGLAQPSLFASHEEMVEKAYEEQGLRIAFRQSVPTPENEPRPATIS